MGDHRVAIRLRSQAERDVIWNAAQAEGLLFSEWARKVLLEAAGAPTSEPAASVAARAMRMSRKS